MSRNSPREAENDDGQIKKDSTEQLDFGKLAISTKPCETPASLCEQDGDDKTMYVGIDLGAESLSIYKKALASDNKADMLTKYSTIVNPGHVTLGFHSDFPSENDFHSFVQTLTEHKKVSFKMTGFCYDEHALAFMVETIREHSYKIDQPQEASSADARAKQPDDDQSDTANDSLNSTQQSDSAETVSPVEPEYRFYPERKYLHVTCLLNGKTRAVYSNKLIRHCVYKYKKHLERLGEIQEASSGSEPRAKAPRELQIDEKTFIKYFDQPVECSGAITFYKFPKTCEPQQS